jgi:DNA-binding Lrp family transcriptional regulator
VIRLVSFLKIEMGAAENLLAALKAIPELIEIDYITGAADIMVVLEGESGPHLHAVLFEGIEALPGVVSCESHLVLSRWSREKP